MTPADTAASEFTRRRAAASRKVAQRQLTAQQANTLVLPWLALACRMGADLPELAEDLADLPTWCTDTQRRAVLADELCPRPQVIESLTAAWIAALHRSERAQVAAGDSADGSAAEITTRAHGLQQLLRLFIDGPLPLPARQPERNAA